LATLSSAGGSRPSPAVFAAVKSAVSHGTNSLAPQAFSGHDTISLGVGSDTIFEAGNATVHGLFGSSSIAGGAVAFVNASSLHEELALSGKETLVGGAISQEFVGQSANLLQGVLGKDVLAGLAAETLAGGAGKNFIEIIGGGAHVISNFVAGKDQLYVEGHSLSYLQQHHDVIVKGGSTYISLDGGKTTIELHGVTGLKASDISTHKP
jgi:hypothetical protein